MTVIVALVPDFEGRSRIREGVAPGQRVTFVDDGDGVIAAVAGGSVSMVVLAPRDRQRRTTAAVAERLREHFPGVPVIAYCSPQGGGSDLLAMARAGVNEVVLRGIDDLRRVLHASLAGAERDCIAARVIAEVGNYIPRHLHPLIVHCIEHAKRPLTVPTLAVALGVHRKTLANQLAAASLPTPGWIVGWSRLLLAGRLLEDPASTVEQVAHALRFSSDAALRNMLKRYTGLGPREVRQNGGLSCVLHAFKRELTRSTSVASKKKARVRT